MHKKWRSIRSIIRCIHHCSDNSSAVQVFLKLSFLHWFRSRIFCTHTIFDHLPITHFLDWAGNTWLFYFSWAINNAHFVVFREHSWARLESKTKEIIRPNSTTRTRIKEPYWIESLPAGYTTWLWHFVTWAILSNNMRSQRLIQETSDPKTDWNGPLTYLWATSVLSTRNKSSRKTMVQKNYLLEKNYLVEKNSRL